MKVTKTQLSMISELKQRGGAVISSRWTTGHGRFTSLRAIPPFCKRIERWAGWFPKYPKRIRDVFKRHPRCKAVIAIVDMRSVNKLLKEAE
jgi:hypothetical protein